MSAERRAGPRTTVGVVGAGNMGAALVRGWARSAEAKVDLVVWDKVKAATCRLPLSESVVVAESLGDLLARAGIVLVVVKPKDAEEVLTGIAACSGGRTVVSSMAGISLARIRALLGPGPAVFRIMPNLAVEVGAGAIALAAEAGAAEADTAEILELLRPLGHAELVSEELLDAVTAVSGSGPAFIALAMEGLEDGAVAAGLSRPAARMVVREAALEAAELLPRFSDSAAGLRDAVSADSGLSRAACQVLEERGVRGAFRQAVEAAVGRSRGLKEAGR